MSFNFLNSINYILFLELCNELQKFIDKCSIEFYDRQTVDAIDSIKNETIEIEDIVKYWEKAFKEVSCYSIKKIYVYFCVLYKFTYIPIFRKLHYILIIKDQVMINCLLLHFTSWLIQDLL